MHDIAKIVDLIQRTSSTNDKKYLLKKNQNVTGLKEVLAAIYDPYNKTGISGAKLNKVLAEVNALPDYVMGEEHFISYQDAIRYFKTHTTGSDADIIMAARFINCTKAMYPDSPHAVDLAKAIISQDLRIGVNAKTLNTVYGDHFIPTVGCMLGTSVTKVKAAKLRFPYIVTEKLDGIRRVLIKRNGVCRMYSRSGHEDEGLVDILAEAKYLPDNHVYDGELLAMGFFVNSIAQRQASSSLSAKKGEKHGLSFNLFDMMPLEDFLSGTSEQGALTRKFILGATLMDESIRHLDPTNEKWPKMIQGLGVHAPLQCIKSVPILGVVNSMEEVTPLVELIWSVGGEGVMLNSVDGTYEIKRSKELLKVKHVESIELEIVDIIEGTGKFEGSMGSVVVDYNGTKVGVGSGFDTIQRQRIWDNPNAYIGRVIEIDTFGESTNLAGQASLNCPIFKRFVGEE